MTKKENRGGNLRNEDIEKELKQRGGGQKTGRSYTGSQDTGDNTLRDYGTEVQRQDGRPPEELQDDLSGGNRDPE